MQVQTSRFLTDFKTLLLCSGIRLIMGVCGRSHCKTAPTNDFLEMKKEKSQFPQVRLFVLIEDDKYVGWENLIALYVMRLYLNKIR